MYGNVLIRNVGTMIDFQGVVLEELEFHGINRNSVQFFDAEERTS